MIALKCKENVSLTVAKTVRWNFATAVLEQIRVCKNRSHYYTFSFFCPWVILFVRSMNQWISPFIFLDEFSHPANNTNFK